MSINPQQVQWFRQNMHRVPLRDRERILDLLEQYDQALLRKAVQTDFMAFVKEMWPEFIAGRHHKIIAEKFNAVAEGKIKRLMIHLAPRHTKSEFGSYLLPAWFLGRFPEKKIIQASNTAELAQGFGRKVRNLVDSEVYQQYFPDTQLRADSKAAGRWDTNANGSYFAIGVGGTMTGRGADLLIIDDPHSEGEAAQAEFQPEIYDRAYEWYTSGPRQRLQPGGAIIIIACVAEGERVLMGDGTWKPIEQICVGDRVIGYDKGKATPKSVTATIPQGEDDILEVVSRSCTVRVNARHPFLVVRGGMASSPKTQEEVIRAREWALEWVPAGELKPKDVVVTVKNVPVGSGHRPAKYRSSRQMTQDDYWLWGFIFGDGWLVRAGARGYTGVCIAASDKPALDAYVLSLAKQCWGAEFAYQPGPGYYRADNKDLARWLAKKGFSSGAKVKRVPDWVFKLRPMDKRAFLMGFAAADGWLRPSEYATTVSIGLANRELVDDLRLLARTCGVRVSKIYEQTTITQAPNSPQPIESQCYMARFSFHTHNRVELRARYSNQGDLGRYFRLEEVERVTPCGRANVYDLTVDGAESFVAEGYVVHNTRWSKRDLPGRIIRESAQRGGDEWEVVEFPAIFEAEGVPGTPEYKPERALWPEYWPLELLTALRNELPVSKWQAQYQQNPVSETSAIIKRTWWRRWDKPKPPPCSFILMCLDTAFEAHNRADYSAFTTWGVFYLPDEDGVDQANIILLNAFRDRLEFPDLKRVAMEQYRRWQPDKMIIEKKASGAPLIYEMRAAGMPVSEYTPVRGKRGQSNDKIARLNAVSDVFASGRVWAPNTHWAEEVIEEVASFPAGEHDDYTDTVSLALAQFRNGGFITTDMDEPDDEYLPVRRAYY